MINYSQLFGIKSRCKYCKSLPKYLAFEISSGLFYYPTKIIDINHKYWKGTVDIRKMIFPIARAPKISISLAQNKVNIKKCKNTRTKQIFSFKPTYICGCYKTAWSTREISDVLYKKHIYQRICWKKYPIDIILI